MPDISLKEYQAFVNSTTKHFGEDKYWYACLGLAGETGELIEQFKKAARTRFSDIAERKENMRSELGDVIWYATRLCSELELSLEDVLEHNVQKLKDRLANGKNGVQGKGYA